MPRAEIDPDTWETIGEDPVEWQRFDATRDALAEKYGEDRVFDLMLLLDKIEQAETSSRGAYDLYRDTAGEIEARDASARRNMTAEERKTRFPDVGNEDTVFAGRGRSYSISKNLDDDLNNVLENKFDSASGEVVVGTTSNFLTEVIGADPLIVTMPSNKAYSAMVTEEQAKLDGKYDPNLNYHGLGKDGLMRVLDASENPIAVFADTSGAGNPRRNRLVIVTDEIINGSNAVVVEEMNTRSLLNGKKITANKTITAYDRAQILSDINSAAADGRLLYIDKKRSPQSAGVPGANYPTAIRNVDFDNNIANFWNNVKWENENKSGIYTVESPTQESAFEKALREAEERKQNKGRQYSFSENNSENEVRDEDVFYERGISDEDTAAELEREEASILPLFKFYFYVQMSKYMIY